MKESLKFKKIEDTGSKFKNASRITRDLSSQAKHSIHKLQDKLGITTVFGGSKLLTQITKDLDLELSSSYHNIDTNQIRNFLSANEIEFEPTTKQALDLHLILCKMAKPELSSSDLAKEMSVYAEKLGEMEKRFSHPSNPLPTIGIEVELPTDIVPSSLKVLLEKISFPAQAEGNSLYELSPSFSYSSWVQGRILQDATALGLVPLSGPYKKERVHPEVPLSLHVNFGVPAVIEWEPATRDPRVILAIRGMSDLFTYAFTSLNRIEKRKTFTSVKYNQPAEPSKKSDEDTFRIEFRALEFKDYPTYRLLAESQRVMGLFFAFVKKRQGLTLSETEQKLAILWEPFWEEVSDYIYGGGDVAPNLADIDHDLVLDLFERKPELRQRCRGMVNKYSRKVADILGEEPTEIDY